MNPLFDVYKIGLVSIGLLLIVISSNTFQMAPSNIVGGSQNL